MDAMKQKKCRIIAVGVLLLCLNGCGFGTGERDYARGIAAYEKGQYEEAAGYFAEALAANEDKAEYYLYYGFALTELGSYDAAAECFERVILDKELTMVKENNKKAYRGAGIAYYLAGQEEKALESFYAALQIPVLDELNEDIRSYMLKVNAALLERYRSEGELERAREMCDALLLAYGESADLFRMRADLWMEEGDSLTALADFDAAIAAGDSRMSTLLGKLQALQALGREEDAAAVSAQIAAMEPQNDEEAYAGAIAAFSIGAHDAAEAEFERLAAGGMVQANYYLAQLCMEKNEYDRAADYLRVLENSGNESAQLYYQLAVCLLQGGRTQEAEQYYDKLVQKQDVSFARRQDKLFIVLLQKQGRYAQAYEKMGSYLEDYVTEQDAEYEEAQKEYEFLRRVVSE